MSAPPARATLDLRVVDGAPERVTANLVMGAMFGVTRRAPYRAAVVVFDVATGRALAAVPADGRPAAEGLRALMDADLDRLDERGFLARWTRPGGPRP